MERGFSLALLPKLAEACPNLDWAKPIGEWPRETMAEFLLAALGLLRRAMIARDFSERQLTGGEPAAIIARQANYGAGGPRMTPDEFDFGIPFEQGERDDRFESKHEQLPGQKRRPD